MNNSIDFGTASKTAFELDLDLADALDYLQGKKFAENYGDGFNAERFEKMASEGKKLPPFWSDTFFANFHYSIGELLATDNFYNH